MSEPSNPSRTEQKKEEEVPMNIQHLIKMANQIERFFAAEPNRADAVAGVRDHLQRFWDPRMRKQIIAHVEAGGEGLGDIVIEAVKSLPPISPKWGATVSAGREEAAA
ncbi:MAG: formate dehydrogenase subunit delta [Pseudomonadota bacterium]